MSQSPAEAGGPGDPYFDGWSAMHKLLRQGYSWSGREPHSAFLNLGDGTFADVSFASGFALPEDGRALLPIDWDFDGDLDLLLTNRTSPRLRVFENRLSSGRSIAIRLHGNAPNTGAIGARVELKLASGATLMRTLRAGEGYLTQRGSWLHFGLGSEEVELALVRWPSGETSLYTEALAPGWYDWRQGGGPEAFTPPDIELEAADPVEPLAEQRTARVILPTPVPLPKLPVLSQGGREGELFGVVESSGGAQRPLLVNLWASWCAPCAKELAEFASTHERLRSAGIEVLALSLDAPEDRDQARELLEKIGWPFPYGFADSEAVEVLDVLQNTIFQRELRMPVPTSFLIDARGRLAALYLGPVAPEQLIVDLGVLGMPANHLRLAAAPFEGRWDAPPNPVDLRALERAYDEHGLSSAAREFHLGQNQFTRLSPAAVHRQFGRQRMNEGKFEDAVHFLETAVQADPEFFEAHADLGVAYALAQRLPEAITTLQQALRLSPQHNETRLRLGLILLENGDIEGARVHWEALVRSRSSLSETLRQQLVEASRAQEKK